MSVVQATKLGGSCKDVDVHRQGTSIHRAHF